MRHVLGMLLVGAAVGLTTAQPSTSLAEDSSALAEQLFDQARELVKANQWAEACPKFEASMRYDPVLGTQLNLAACYEHTGRLASAWGLYREAIVLARKAGDTRRVQYAEKHAAALEPRLPRLAIIAPVRPLPGLVVKRDETTLDSAALGVALYIDPGGHRVTASAPGFGTFDVSVVLVEGKTEAVTIPPLVAAPSDDTRDAAVQPARESSAAAHGRTSTYIALGIGGAGVAAIGIGVVFGLRARASNNEAKELCGADLSCSAAAYSRGKQLVADARGSATISTVALVGGVTATVAAVIVYLTASSTGESRSAHIVPILRDRGAALALTGTL